MSSPGEKDLKLNLGWYHENITLIYVNNDVINQQKFILFYFIHLYKTNLCGVRVAMPSSTLYGKIQPCTSKGNFRSNDSKKEKRKKRKVNIYLFYNKY